MSKRISKNDDTDFIPVRLEQENNSSASKSTKQTSPLQDSEIERTRFVPVSIQVELISSSFERQREFPQQDTARYAQAPQDLIPKSEAHTELDIDKTQLIARNAPEQQSDAVYNGALECDHAEPYQRTLTGPQAGYLLNHRVYVLLISLFLFVVGAAIVLFALQN